MIQKLSPRQSNLETRMKILHEIAAENGTVLKLDDSSLVIKEVTKLVKLPNFKSKNLKNIITLLIQVDEESPKGVLDDEIVEVLSFNESRTGKKKYKDVEDAAQAAFESAAYAAAAARAAVELSRSRSFGSDNPDSPNTRPRKVLNFKNEKSKLHLENEETLVFDESDVENEVETSEFSSSKEPEFGAGNVETGFGDGVKVPELDLTKRPMSVRTRRVYGR